jgi:hypothetical protein
MRSKADLAESMIGAECGILLVRGMGGYGMKMRNERLLRPRGCLQKR